MDDKKEDIKVDEELIQRKYIELQQMGKQIKQGQQQLDALDEQLDGMARLLDDLDGLKDSENGSEMLSAIGDGLFVKASLKDNNRLIVNVGAGVAVERTVDETKEMITGKLGQAHKHREAMLEELQAMVEQARHAEKELSALIE